MRLCVRDSSLIMSAVVLYRKWMRIHWRGWMATWNTFRNQDHPLLSQSISLFISGKQRTMWLMPVLVSAQVQFLGLGVLHFVSLNAPSCSSGFRTVSFTLRTKDILSTVTNILKSCSLPVEHMSRLKSSREKSSRTPEPAVPFYRPIKWDKSYYAFTGFRDPEEDLQQATRVEPTLRSSLYFLEDISGLAKCGIYFVYFTQ